MPFKDFEGIESGLIDFFIENLPKSFTVINNFYNDFQITAPTIDDIQLTLISAPANTENPVIAGLFDLSNGADSGRGKLSTSFKFRWIHFLAIGDNNSTEIKRKILFRQLAALLLTIDNCFSCAQVNGISNQGLTIDTLTPAQAINDLGQPIGALASGIIINGVIK